MTMATMTKKYEPAVIETIRDDRVPHARYGLGWHRWKKSGKVRFGYVELDHYGRRIAGFGPKAAYLDGVKLTPTKVCWCCRVDLGESASPDVFAGTGYCDGCRVSIEASPFK
jgi:hypothetical protein